MHKSVDFKRRLDREQAHYHNMLIVRVFVKISNMSRNQLSVSPIQVGMLKPYIAATHLPLIGPFLININHLEPIWN